MPYRVEYRPVKQSSKDWAIVNKETGRVVGRSTSKDKARKSIKARLAGEYGWKPK